MKAIFSVLLLTSVNPAQSFELIAHRGVHQSYNRDGLTNQTCTASRIDDTGHKFLENTLESIEESFRLGANIVELDIHPVEKTDGPTHLVVFHDWTLNCRTNASCQNGCNCSGKGLCVSHEQTLEYIKSLDIGHGYSHDQGKTFPFRGTHLGDAPSFREVLTLLEKYPDRKILVNQKDTFKKTVEDFLEIISEYPEPIRKQVLFPRFVPGFDTKLDQLSVAESIYQSKKAKTCLKDYILKGWLRFPTTCKNLKFFVPVRETLGRVHPWLSSLQATDLLWGWPGNFIAKAHKHGSEVYASQVDSIEELENYLATDIDGVMTNKIELIGPYLKRLSAKSTSQNSETSADTTEHSTD